MMHADAIDRPTAEGALARTLSLLEAALDAATDGILVVDQDRRVIAFNEAFLRMWRLPPNVADTRAEAALIRACAQQLEEPAAFVARIEAIYAQPEAASLDVMVLNDGCVYERHSLAQRVKGEIVGRVWRFRDVTIAREGVCSEAGPPEAEARYRTLVEHAPEAILVIDPARRTFTAVNENAVRLFGHPREQLLSLGPADLSPVTQPGGRPSAELIREQIEAVLEGGVAVFEWTHRSAAGRIFPGEVRLVRLPGPGVPRLRASVTDITERKRTEALLAGQRRVLELIVTGASLPDTLTTLVRFLESQSEGMIGSVLLLDEDGRHLRQGAAPGLPDAFNRTIEGAEIGPAVGSCGTAAYRRAPVIVRDIQTDPLWADYHHLATPYGLRACWSTPILSYTGVVLGTFAMYYREPRTPVPADLRVIEIATHLAGVAIERRRAEETLRRRAAEIEDLYENAPCGYLSTDREGRIVQMNATELAWLGYTREEVVGEKRFRDLLTAESWEVLSARLPSFLQDREGTAPLRNLELDMVRKDGSLLPVLLGASAARDAEGALLLGRVVVIDNAQRKRDAETLRESERTYRALYTSTPVMMHSIDPAGRLLSVSDDWLATLGYERSEVIGRRSIEFLTPESARYAVEVVLPAYRQTGRCKDVPYQFVKKGGEVLDVLLSATAERDAEGRPTRSLAVLIDVTARRRAEEELQRYREHLEELVAARTRKLESVNQELEAFCSSVSHDLRAPLRSIDGFSQILLEDYGATLDARGREHLLRIRAADQRMALLIDDLLNLSRVGRAELSRQPVDLSALAREVVAELVHPPAPGREVDWVIEDGVVAEGDPRLLRVVLENLLGNAWKFTSKHPRARIEFGRTTEGPDTPVYFVRDDGAGFDMAYADKLFGAFQRLHAVNEFEGTGIGLATVQRILQRHGGRVWAEGAVEHGATFSFTL